MNREEDAVALSYGVANASSMMAFSVLYSFILLSAYRKSLLIDNEVDVETSGAGVLEMRSSTGIDTILDLRPGFSEQVMETNRLVKHLERERDEGRLLAFFSEKIVSGNRVVKLIPFRDSDASMKNETRYLPFVFYVSGSTASGESVFLYGTVKSLEFRAIATDIWNLTLEGADNSLTNGAASLARHIRVDVNHSSLQDFSFKVSGETVGPFSMVHVTGFGLYNTRFLPHLTADEKSSFFYNSFRSIDGGIAWMHPSYQIVSSLRRCIYLNPSLKIVQLPEVQTIDRVIALSTGPIATRYAYEIDLDPNARLNGKTLPLQLRIANHTRPQDPATPLDPRLVFGTFNVTRALFYTATKIPDAMVFSNPVLLGLSFEIAVGQKRKWVVMETDIQQIESDPKGDPAPSNLPTLRVRWMLMDESGQTVLYGNNTDQNSFSSFDLEFLGGLGSIDRIVPISGDDRRIDRIFLHDGLNSTFSQAIHDKRHGKDPSKPLNTVYIEDAPVKQFFDIAHRSDSEYTTSAVIVGMVIMFSLFLFVYDTISHRVYDFIGAVAFFIIGALLLFGLAFIGIVLYLIYSPSDVSRPPVFEEILETSMSTIFPFGLLAMFICNAIATLAYSAQVNAHISAFNLAILAQYVVIFVVLQSKQLYNAYVELDNPTKNSQTNMILLFLFALCFTSLAGGQLFRVYAIMSTLSKMSRHIADGRTKPKDYDWGLPIVPIETVLQLGIMGIIVGLFYFMYSEKKAHLKCTDSVDDAMISNALHSVSSRLSADAIVPEETNKEWKQLGLSAMQNFYRDENTRYQIAFQDMNCSRERYFVKTFDNGFNGLQLSAALLAVFMLLVPTGIWYTQRYLKPSAPLIRFTGRLPRPTNTQIAEENDKKAMKVIIHTLKRNIFTVGLMLVVLCFRVAFVYHQGMLDYINPIPSPGICSVLAEQKDSFRVKYADGFTTQIEERSKQLEDAYASAECVNDMDKWLFYVLFFACGAALSAAMMISSETPIQYVQHSATSHFLYTLLLAVVSVVITTK
jgi:hypothetical protein